MPITIKFFAHLREEFNIDEMQVDYQDNLSVLQIWQNATGQTQLPDKVLIAVNQEYTNETHLVKENDEVAFFPPVTGG